MPKAIVSFLSPIGSPEVGESLARDGWSSEGSPGSGRPVIARYDGPFPRSALDRLVSALDRCMADYVALTMPGFDAALDAPIPAWIEVPGRWRRDGEAIRLPRGFADPAIDLRTLTSAGMPAERAADCLRTISPPLAA